MAECIIVVGIHGENVCFIDEEYCIAQGRSILRLMLYIFDLAEIEKIGTLGGQQWEPEPGGPLQQLYRQGIQNLGARPKASVRAQFLAGVLSV